MTTSLSSFVFVCSSVRSCVRLFVRAFVGWMYGCNDRGWFASIQTALCKFAFIAACLNARSCNLAHSHALFVYCPNTLQWMPMTTLFIFNRLFVRWMYGWNGWVWRCACWTTRAGYVAFAFIACCLHEYLKLQSRSPSCAILLSNYDNQWQWQLCVDVRWMIFWMYGTTLSCWPALHKWTAHRTFVCVVITVCALVLEGVIIYWCSTQYEVIALLALMRHFTVQILSTNVRVVLDKQVVRVYCCVCA